MLPFLGSSKKNLIEQVTAATWKTPEDRDALLKQLRESGAKPLDVLNLLFHGDASVRVAAAELFLAKVDERAVVALLETMGDKPPHVRSGLMRVVNRVNDEVLTRVIDSMLVDKSSIKQRLGWEYALALSGAVRNRYLEKAIHDAPPVIRATALQKLLQERDPTTIVDLLLTCAKDADARLASVAQEALVKVNDPRVMELMLDRFVTGDATSQQRAAAWLRERAAAEPLPMRKKMLELLGSGEDAIRRQAMEILFTTGAPDVLLVEVLAFCRDLVGWLRTRILETLRTFGDQVLRPAVALLNHPEEEIRTAALVLCEHFHDPRLVEPVGKLLSDPDWWLRISACDTLGRLGDERAVPFLVKALEDQETRWAAIDALAHIASPTALKPLAGLLRDPRVEVRLEVIKAFSKFNDPRLVSLLTAVKEKDPSSEVRTRAAEVARDLSERLHQKTEGVDQGTSSVSARSLARPLDQLLARIREMGASDVHLTVDEPPFIRMRGQVSRLEGHDVVTAEQAREWVLGIMEERQKKTLLDAGEIDFCHAIPEVGRYRSNAFVQRKGMCASFRVIPNVPPTFADLRLPGRLTELLDYHQGIIVVSGPAGSGKSTTLAAIINLINETKADHVISMEDPIEFVHPIKSALINQREVGRHTASFSRALRAALREDPDVIVVGEMRDVETVRLALTAAETGHLVVATMHTTGAVATIERLIKSFPPEEQSQVRMGLSESLKYIVSQSLVPRKDGQGRAGVYEVLKGTFNIGNLIRDNKTYQIPSMMQLGRRLGMQTRDQALMDLVDAGLVAAEMAWLRADKPETFEGLCDPAFLREKAGAST